MTGMLLILYSLTFPALDFGRRGKENMTIERYKTTGSAVFMISRTTMDFRISYLGFKRFRDLVDKNSFTLRRLDICNASALRAFQDKKQILMVP
jgi:hypothetical protein